VPGSDGEAANYRSILPRPSSRPNLRVIVEPFAERTTKRPAVTIGLRDLVCVDRGSCKSNGAASSTRGSLRWPGK
jgi:hypothetical protein